MRVPRRECVPPVGPARGDLNVPGRGAQVQRPPGAVRMGPVQGEHVSAPVLQGDVGDGEGVALLVEAGVFVRRRQRRRLEGQEGQEVVSASPSTTAADTRKRSHAVIH